MAQGRLRWSGTKLGSFPDGRACLIVHFLDQEGNLREWVPAWGQMRELLDRAANTEVVNKPDSGWVAEFARTAHDVFNKLEPFGDARKVEGTLRRVERGNLCFSYHDESGADQEESIAPAFRVTEDFLDSWLGTRVSALVLNGHAVRLSRVVQREVPKNPFEFFGTGEMVIRRYLETYPACPDK